MATYVTLINWTEKGLGGFRETVNRVDVSVRQIEQMGGKLKDIYWTLGPHDIVAISEFPDDETSEAFALWIGSQGNIRTTTLRAFTREEMAAIIDKTR